MNITFDDNLITGNKTIDSQHQELIDRIRQFVAACESGDSKIKAIKMLDYLDEYTNFHFQEEEELQKKVSYPEFSGHHAKHEEFKTSIQELYDYLNENEGPDDQFIEQVKRQIAPRASMLGIYTNTIFKALCRLVITETVIEKAT